MLRGKHEPSFYIQLCKILNFKLPYSKIKISYLNLSVPLFPYDNKCNTVLNTNRTKCPAELYKLFLRFRDCLNSINYSSKTVKGKVKINYVGKFDLNFDKNL